MGGRKIAHPFAYGVDKAGLTLKGRVRFEESVVNGASLLVVLHLENAEARVDRIQQCPIALIAISQLTRGQILGGAVLKNHQEAARTAVVA